jgi:hypothetical protein
MRVALGTVIASTPALERVRSRNVFPFRSSSTDSTITGSFTSSIFRTGCFRTSSSCSLVTLREVPLVFRSPLEAQPAAAAARPAADCMNARRVVGMREW